MASMLETSSKRGDWFALLKGRAAPADTCGTRARLHRGGDVMETCVHCRSGDVVGFTLAPKGQPLRFCHCRSCEHRWWTDPRGGTAVPLTAVLDHIGGRAA
jgi:hypothetical protein